LFLCEISEIDKSKFAYGMEKMLEVFENDGLSEYFFRKIDGTWIEEMK
jgi:hypothetical protein